MENTSKKLSEKEDNEYSDLLEIKDRQWALFKEHFIEKFKTEWGISFFMPRGYRNKERLEEMRSKIAKTEEEYFAKIEKCYQKWIVGAKAYLKDIKEEESWSIFENTYSPIRMVKLTFKKEES